MIVVMPVLVVASTESEAMPGRNEDDVVVGVPAGKKRRRALGAIGSGLDPDTTFPRLAGRVPTIKATIARVADNLALFVDAGFTKAMVRAASRQIS